MKQRKQQPTFPNQFLLPPPPTVLWNFHNGSVLASDFMGIQAFFITNLKCKGAKMKQMPLMTAK